MNPAAVLMLLHADMARARVYNWRSFEAAELAIAQRILAGAV